MSVAARLFVTAKRYSHADAEIGDLLTVEMAPVNRCHGPAGSDESEPEDSIYGKYTPSGEVTLTMVKGAADFFEPGAKYRAVFTRVE